MGYGGYGYYYGFDWTYILVLIGVVISMAASAKVNSTFNRYSRTWASCGITGAEAARRILNAQGIYDVTVRHVAGNLTDHFDPRSKTVNLSDAVYNSSSISAIGVAAHECGHVIQDARGYVPLKIRASLVPVANFGSRLAMPLIILGLIVGGLGSPMVEIGIIMFSLAVLFQLVTLPVEFNASARALRILGDSYILNNQEVGQARKVLGAAALTYVAAAAASILQLLRLVILFGGRRNDD
ncbi:MAG: zinc metallopeptidase [Lachnospiraceae bacterium]|nr:zinc metallopeptidase [Lachnospiraceae bacterium]